MTDAPYAEINRAALRHNFHEIRRRAGPRRVMAIVKANGYGHGALRVVRALPDADAFGVARLDEGIALREGGVERRIVILQGFLCAEDVRRCVDHRLEPVVHSAFQLDLLDAAPAPLVVWLKIDTGMHRLGLSPDEFRIARDRLQCSPGVLQPVHLMSHFACADEPGSPDTPRQLALFNDLAGACVPRSLANSAGLFGWPEAHLDWVRPGIALYGVSPFADPASGDDLALQPVMTLKTRLIAIKTLNAGDAVGYGASWTCARPTRIGIAAIGYGDGYPRHATSGTPVLVNGWRAPLVGRVSMDMVTVDLTDLPPCAPGDPVTLWGEGLPVEVIARHAGTIPYEILCGITQRVRIVEKEA